MCAECRHAERTSRKAEKAGVELVLLGNRPVLDLGVARGRRESIRCCQPAEGRGGALCYEKIVAECLLEMAPSLRLQKSSSIGWVRELPLPRRSRAFWLGTNRTRYSRGRARTAPAADIRWGFILTDSGHFILDCQTLPIEDAPALASRVKALTGVVDHGLFIGQGRQSCDDRHGGSNRYPTTRRPRCRRCSILMTSQPPPLPSENPDSQGGRPEFDLRRGLIVLVIVITVMVIITLICVWLADRPTS